MTEQVRNFDQARQEAADWLTLLSSRTVSTTSVTAFRDWRRDPINAAAYASVESVWKRAIGLNDDPDKRRVLTEAQQRKRRTKGALSLPGGRGVAAASVAVLAALLVVAGLQFFNHGERYSTGVGEERLVRLSDGSRVRLDTDTSLSVRLTSRDRHVELTRGRALFDVTRDTARPFVVTAGQAEVRALGTRFEVRRDQDRVDVVLIDGSVRVDKLRASKEGYWVLEAGQKLRLERNAKTPPHIEPVDSKAATSWTEGRLFFKALPLATAVVEVNRYSQTKVVLDAEGLTKAPVSGAFDTGDTEAFVSAVSVLFDLTPLRLADGTVRLSATNHTSDQHSPP